MTIQDLIDYLSKSPKDRSFTAIAGKPGEVIIWAHGQDTAVLCKDPYPSEYKVIPLKDSHYYAEFPY